MSKLLDTLSRIFVKNSDGELKNITGSIDDSLNLASEDIEQLALQYIIPTATGEWLDEWGSWFGVPRILGEKDPEYRTRILVSATKPKNTIPAIIDAVNTLNGITEGTVIYEPYSNVAKFNMSAFSGKDHFQDGVYWRHNTIDVIMPSGGNIDVYKEVQKIKAAGIKVYFTSKVPIILDKTFNQAVKSYDDYSINLDLAMARMRAGSLFSDKNPRSRGRSGNMRLWGTSVGFLFDIEMQSYVRGYDGVPFSKQHTLDKMYEPELIVKQPPASFSSQSGVLSSDTIETARWVEVDITPWIRANYQPDFVARVMNLRPGDRSSLGNRSGKHAMSGIENGGWTPKPFYLFQNAGYVVFDILNSASDTSFLEIEMVIDRTDYMGGKGKRTRSSRRTTWEGSTIAFESGYPLMRRTIIGSPLYSADDLQKFKHTYETIYQTSKTFATTLTDQDHTRVYELDEVTSEDFTDYQSYTYNPIITLQANIGSPTNQPNENHFIVVNTTANAVGMVGTPSITVAHESGLPMMRRKMIGSPIYSLADLSKPTETYDTVYEPNKSTTTTFANQGHTLVYKRDEVNSDDYIDFQAMQYTQIFSMKANIGSPTSQTNEYSQTIQLTSNASGMLPTASSHTIMQESDFPVMRRTIIGSPIYSITDLETSGLETYETVHNPQESTTTTLAEQKHTRIFKDSDVTSEDHIDYQGETDMNARFETLATTMVEDVF